MKTAKFYMFDHKPDSDSCWSLHAGPDGRVYAASCCEYFGGGEAKIVRYNDATDSLDTVLNVAQAAGEPGTNGKASQCKIHYSFAPSSDGILYMATHLSAPGMGMRRYSAWNDWKDEKRSFPHSVLIAFDTRTDRVAWTSPFIPREGCRCLSIDEKRGLLYAVSYPRDHFWVFDLKTRSIRSLGRMGSINSQVIFTDRRGRAFTSNGDGQLVRYDPDTDRLEEIPVYVPHAPSLSGWHCVFYDVVASPEGDCVYGVPWTANPHMFRYWPEEGAYGRMEDLGPVHQPRDETMPIAFYLDHCGGLVFGADGKLYYSTTRWPEGLERYNAEREGTVIDQIVVQMDVKTLAKVDYAKLEKPGAFGHYVSRAARDAKGNLFFGDVNRPIPVGLSRLAMEAKGDNLHLPLRTWG